MEDDGEFSIRPAPGTCCPEMRIKDGVCQGCGKEGGDVKRFCLDFYIFISARNTQNAKKLQGNILKDLQQHLGNHSRFKGLDIKVEDGELIDWPEEDNP